MGLASMRHDKTTRMPVVSLIKAKSTHVVNAAGESNGAPGITEVKRSAFRVDMHLEYQNLVIMPRTTEVTAVASSKLGQSSTDDGCWLTRTKQTGVTVLVKGAAKKCKHTVKVLPDERRTAPDTVGDPPLGIWHHDVVAIPTQ